MPRIDPNRLKRFLGGGALIIALAVAAHAGALRAGFIWDDDVYVTANPHLHDAAGLYDVWFTVGATKQYDPLVFTTFWIEQHLWGMRPLGYHAVNIAMHALGALLFWTLLRRLAVPGAWFAAALFAVHPTSVESVAWVAELKNVQSGVFAAACLLAYWRFARAGCASEADAAAHGPWRSYLLALALFAASLLSKPVVVSLPLVILLLIWWKRGRLVRADVLRVVPMLAMSAGAGAMAIFVERSFGGATGTSWQMPFVERILVAGRALSFYVATLVWPVGLTSIYPRWDVNAAAWWQWLYPLAWVAGLAALWIQRNRIGRAPLTAAASFALLVAPLTGLFNVSYHLYSFVADHFQYHGAAALMAFAGASVAAFERAAARRGAAPFVKIGCVALVAALTVASALRTRAFESEESRCRDALRHNPTTWLAMNNLGVALNRQGRPAEAVEWYAKALRTRPVYPEARSNWGVALVAMGKPKEAIPHYREALRIWPDYAMAHQNLATALAATGAVDEAIHEYREALRANPANAEAHNNLATVLGRAGRVDEAVEQHREAVRLNPRYADARTDLGVTLASAGRFAEAIPEYETALTISPNEPRALANLAAALASTGRVEDAITRYREALSVNPDYAEARNGLGMALAAVNRPADAIAEFEHALRITPGYAEAHNNLGTALAAAGMLPAAVRQFKEAVRLDPRHAEARCNLGKALMSAGEIQGAVAEFEAALQVREANADCHNLLGVALAESGKMSKAAVHFARALELAPDDRGARDNLNRVRLLEGRK